MHRVWIVCRKKNLNTQLLAFLLNKQKVTFNLSVGILPMQQSAQLGALGSKSWQLLSPHLRSFPHSESLSQSPWPNAQGLDCLQKEPPKYPVAGFPSGKNKKSYLWHFISRNITYALISNFLCSWIEISAVVFATLERTFAVGVGVTITLGNRTRSRVGTKTPICR